MRDTNDYQYSEYIDNEQICKLKGIPCNHGIPCCSSCYTPETIKKQKEISCISKKESYI